MGGHQFIYDPYTTYGNSHHLAKDVIPQRATGIKQCGCYTIEEKDESDRVWVTYTHIHTYHHYCKDHFKKHLESTQKQKK